MNQEEIHNFTTQLGSVYSNLIINKLTDTKEKYTTKKKYITLQLNWALEFIYQQNK